MKSLSKLIENLIDNELNKKFDLEEFKTKPTYKEKLLYLRTTLYPQKGISGQMRIVFYLDNDKVLKLEKDEPYENPVEIETSNCLNGYATKVLDFDPNGTWLIAQRAEKISEADFHSRLKSLLGMEINDQLFVEALTIGVYKTAGVPRYGTTNKEAVAINDQLFSTNKWYKDLLLKLVECRVSPFDLEARNWGLLNGKLVMLDYGFSKL